ncbi:MAG: transposase [Nitrososphaeraceae archaeon]
MPGFYGREYIDNFIHRYRKYSQYFENLPNDRIHLTERSGQTLNEFFFSNDKDGTNKLTKIVLGYGNCEAVVESTANMWIRIHDTLEDNGINAVLANPYKTRIIAEAKIKSDKLDARILADLLRSGLVYQS